jgi:hypothetical protein
MRKHRDPQFNQLVDLSQLTESVNALVEGAVEDRSVEELGF